MRATYVLFKYPIVCNVLSMKFEPVTWPIFLQMQIRHMWYISTVLAFDADDPLTERD